MSTQQTGWGCLWHRKWAKNWILLDLWSLTSQPPELWEWISAWKLTQSTAFRHEMTYAVPSRVKAGPRVCYFAASEPWPPESGWRRRIFSRWKHSSFKIFIYFCTWLCCILAAACRILSCSMTAHLRHEGSSSLTKDRTLGPLHWECGVLATEPLWKSLVRRFSREHSPSPSVL